MPDRRSTSTFTHTPVVLSRIDPSLPPRTYDSTGTSPTPPPRENPDPRRCEEERVLLRRIAEGDEAALGTLYDRCSPLVHSLVLQLLGDPDDAEEVVEETFWQVWRQSARYEIARGSVTTWLVMIARSRALDRLRARKGIREEYRAETPEPTTPPEEGMGPVSPLESAERVERGAIVRNALGLLPVEQRNTLELAFYQGLSQSEIAARTGEPLGTVKTRVRLAMKKLKETLSILREDSP